MKRFYAAILSLLVLLLLPVIFWYAQNNTSMNIAIIDKTVPNTSYREHLGLIWALNHFKYTNGNDKMYDASSDYFGFVPQEEKRSFQTRALPTDYSDYDVIYLADTYGVYEDDLPWINKSREGARTSKLYGGLEDEEWNAILRRTAQQKKSLLVAEFNTFASPTEGGVRDLVADYLGLDWSGWIGRYFNELDPELNPEIPQWIIDEYKDSWTYRGRGFVLVNEMDYKVIVLESGKHIDKGGIRVSFTDKGRELFDLKSSPDYQYWFDIVTPKSDTTVLANYEWSLTAEGKQLLETHRIPAEFAAIAAREHGESASYYFAGDYNDVASVPKFYQIKGLQPIYKIAQRFSDDAFYWSVYVPVMKTILKQFETKRSSEADSAGELQYRARVENGSYEIRKDGKWTPVAIKGVNMGMGKPGHFPGEAAITEEEYYRWFEYIGEMNANAIRVYTLHPPGFYNALKRYNEKHAQKPLYLFHGVWINEEKLEASLDAFDKDNVKEFQDEMRKIVDVVHGNKVVEAQPGHASGTYRSDVSPYVIGWILGIEWYPYMVLNTNEKHASIGDYNGQYFETKNGQAFEYWLAQQMDLIVAYEKERYNWIRPISFTNWVTTDILAHPAEPDKDEDLVSVNPNAIYTKNETNLTKQFASYHIYPYYPDFLNFEQSYQAFVDHRGQFNSYAAYLAELHAAHRLPILVAEFGVPGSRGLTHVNPFGWNQGFLSETEQGEIVSRLFEDIMAEKLLGGLVFTWQDEWFKRTWNTVDHDNPDRRPFWSNAQTNEQQFGLLSFDRHKIRIDGRSADWQKPALYGKQDGALRSLYVDHDERYLYIRLDRAQGAGELPKILLDVVPGQGNHTIAGIPDIRFANGVDFIIDLAEERIVVDAYYDFFNYQYGHLLNLLDPKPELPSKDSGKFTVEQYALNKRLFLPQQNKTVPFSSYEAGKLRKGNGNPQDEAYDSLADYSIGSDGMIEIRIPWLLIRAKDPSQKQFVGDLYADGITASKFIEQIYVGALSFDPDGKVTDSLPAAKHNVIEPMKGYTWEKWDLPANQERLKRSYDKVKALFAKF